MENLEEREKKVISNSQHCNIVQKELDWVSGGCGWSLGSVTQGNPFLSLSLCFRESLPSCANLPHGLETLLLTNHLLFRYFVVPGS